MTSDDALRPRQPRCEFWTDSLSYAVADLEHVRGHRQVTDAYLASLTQANGGRLVTLDEAVANELPETVSLVRPEDPTGDGIACAQGG